MPNSLAESSTPAPFRTFSTAGAYCLENFATRSCEALYSTSFCTSSRSLRFRARFLPVLSANVRTLSSMEFTHVICRPLFSVTG